MLPGRPYSIPGGRSLPPHRWESGTLGLDHTALTTYGQDIYSTGNADYYAENGSVMAVDGKLGANEPYVCVTPNYVDKQHLTAEYRYKGYSTNGVKGTEGNEKYGSDLKYYVAQDEDYVYLLIEDYAPYFEKDGKEGFTSTTESLILNYYNVRVGFDPEHYDRYLYM